MRAPGAAWGVYALECAMDELAVRLAMDPVELRLKNYAERDQNDDAPFSEQTPARLLSDWRRKIRLVQANRRAALNARRRPARRLGNGGRRVGSDAEPRPVRKPF